MSTLVGMDTEDGRTVTCRPWQQIPMTDPAPGLLKRHGPDGLIETWDNTFRGGGR